MRLTTLFTEHFHTDFSPLIRTNTSGLFNNQQHFVVILSVIQSPHPHPLPPLTLLPQ